MPNEFNDILIKTVYKELKRRFPQYDVSLFDPSYLTNPSYSHRAYICIKHCKRIRDRYEAYEVIVGITDDLVDIHFISALDYAFALHDPSVFDQIASLIEAYMKCDIREAKRRLNIYGWWAESTATHERAARLFYKWLLRQK